MKIVGMKKAGTLTGEVWLTNDGGWTDLPFSKDIKVFNNDNEAVGATIRFKEAYTDGLLLMHRRVAEKVKRVFK